MAVKEFEESAKRGMQMTKRAQPALDVTTIERLDHLYTGKAKSLYRTNVTDVLWVEFRDDLTAGDGKKRGQEAGKGAINAKISAHLFDYLEREGVRTHFLKALSPTVHIVRAVHILPLEVVVRNIAAGSLVKRIGWEEGRPLPGPLIEWYYKRDDLGDPLLTEAHIALLSLVDEPTLRSIQEQAMRINTLLKKRFSDVGMVLVDFKLEFGRLPSGDVILADEISPDTCRLWDASTRTVYDKDRFRKDMGDVLEGYQEVARRLGVL